MRPFLTVLLVSLFSFTFLNAANYSGTIKFRETVINSSSTSTADTILEGATVTVTGSTQTTTGVTDSTGAFTVSNNDTTVTISVSTEGSNVKVGSSASGSTINGVYTHTLIANTTTEAHGTFTIEDTSVTPAFNIFNQLVRGRNFLANLSTPITTSTVTNCIYSTSQATQYKPVENYMVVQNQDSDDDGWDDDIILHEFGHWVAENFSKDSSEGGFHSVTSSLDLRLSYSEGLAHYISSAIRGSGQHLDNNNSGTSSFNIASPGSSQGAEIEIAVSNFIWQISQAYGHNAVFETLTSFNSLPASISSDPISLDTFNDMWEQTNPTLSIATYVSDRGMSYYTDSVASSSASSPSSISTPDSFIATDLSFFGNGDEDYFVLAGSAGTNYHIETGNIKNGALTSLRIYKDNTSNLIASNDQRSSSQTNTSYIFLQASDSANYIIKCSRFNSTTQNYGLDSSGSYTRTVGRYGTYALAVTKATGGENPSTSNHSSLFVNSTGSTSTTTTTTTTSGGGGCLLRRR